MEQTPPPAPAGLYNVYVAKYYVFLKTQISLVSTYRFDLMWRWISNVFEVVVYYSLWSMTASGNAGELKKILTYYVLFYGFMHNTQSSRVAAWMGEDINSGNLNHYLTKPVNFPLMTIIRTVAMLLSRIIVPILMLVVGIVVFPKYIAPASTTNGLLFIIFAVLSFVLWNLMMVIIGSIAFWVSEIGALKTVLDLIISFIKGSFIPFYLYPEKLKYVLSFTPFQYLAAFPIDLYQGLVDTNMLWNGLLVCSFWILALGFLSNYIYKAGIKRYEANG